MAQRSQQDRSEKAEWNGWCTHILEPARMQHPMPAGIVLMVQHRAHRPSQRVGGFDSVVGGGGGAGAGAGPHPDACGGSQSERVSESIFRVSARNRT